MYSSVYDRFDHLNNVGDDEQIISIKSLLSVINSRDRYTYNHTDRVVHYCEVFAKYAKLPQEQSKALLYSAYLHDIGKINVPQEILISEKKLTNEQWELMKQHPTDGADIVRKIENFDTIADIVEQHHEKFDGTGYPNGKKGDELHYLARILTLADSFDAMTAKRPYQKSKTVEEAYAEIIRCAGTQFDPELAQEFVDALKSSYL
jgi:putative nucleotidyltransferase with HDIG domain